MKNQNKIDTNISISDEKQVYPQESLNDVSKNIQYIELKVENSNENLKEISIDKSLSKKNGQNNGSNYKAKDMYSEGKSEIKFNFNIPFENNIFQTLKENFTEKNINDINQNNEKIYNESKLGIQDENLNINPAMNSISNIPEKDKNNLNFMNNLLNQSGEKEVT